MHRDPPWDIGWQKVVKILIGILEMYQKLEDSSEFSNYTNIHNLHSSIHSKRDGRKKVQTESLWLIVINEQWN